MEKQNENREQLKKMYVDFNLTPSDVFTHKNYLILTRSGIEKIMAKSGVSCTFEITGSALRGATYKDGNTLSHYVLEMAEKRSMARAVLKILNLYEYNVKSEDESDEFIKTN